MGEANTLKEYAHSPRIGKQNTFTLEQGLLGPAEKCTSEGFLWQLKNFIQV